MNSAVDITPTYETLCDLLDELSALRHRLVEEAGAFLAPFQPELLDEENRVSASNLAHYLILRRQDLRPLQDRLAQCGLSSLGRGEANVLENLDRILQILRVALRRVDGETAVFPTLNGRAILDENTGRLFGPQSSERRTRVMVTMPSEAAMRPELVRELVEEGMDCARINCAHDGPDAWRAMIANIRLAAVETGRSCRVLMDLAGHKLRTGHLAEAPAVIHVKVSRDAMGRATAPADVLLWDAASTPRDGIGLPSALFERLRVGDRLEFDDTRNKPRYFELVEQRDGLWHGRCAHNAYLTGETSLLWKRRAKTGEMQTLGQCRPQGLAGKPVQIRLFDGDPLLLTRESIPGQPHRYCDEGDLAAPAHIGVTEPRVLESLRVGDPVWIDDGKIGAVVTELLPDGVLLRINHVPPNGERLRGDKGLNLPATRLELPPFSAKDLSDLAFVVEHADMVGFSFVESLDQIKALLVTLDELGAKGLPIIAKIETELAVRNLPEIILGALGRHPLGVMIARGDLAVELGNVRLAEIQEELLWLCEAAHVPAIWATQVLETTAKKGQRSRAEFTDAAMGVRAECVMLNKGPFIVDALRALNRILIRMQEHLEKKSSLLRALHSW